MGNIDAGLGKYLGHERVKGTKGSREAKRTKYAIDHSISNPIALETKGGENGGTKNRECETLGFSTRV